MGQDIKLRSTEFPVWDASNPRESLRRLVDHAEWQAKDAADWYNRGKSRKKMLSSITRSSAIILTALGGLIPVIATLYLPNANDELARLRFHQWGYLSIGLAGVALGFDRFYGGSSGWMRYINALLTIETLIAEFRLDWNRLDASLATSPNDAELINATFDRVRLFVLAVRAQVEKETQAWVTEFQSTLAQLERQTEEALQAAREAARREVEELQLARKAAVEAERPGAINVTVKSPPLAAGFDVELDGRRVKHGVTGRTAGITGVPPGLHELSVSAMAADGRTLHVSLVVAVTPMTLTDVTAELF